MERVTITFADGTEIKAEANATSYITDEKPVFGDLSEVTIDGTEGRTIKNARVLECASVDGRYWFGFQEIPKQDIVENEVVRQRGDIDYIAMMCDVELESEV